MSRAAAAPPTLAPPRRLAPRVRARLRVPRRALTPGCKAYHPDRHFTFDENHDTQFLSWLADLTVAVENSTWTAVPALLRFPRAKPHVVLQLAAGDGQLRLVETILRSCDDLGVRAGLTSLAPPSPQRLAGIGEHSPPSSTPGSVQTRWTNTTPRYSPPPRAPRTSRRSRHPARACRCCLIAARMPALPPAAAGGSQSWPPRKRETRARFACWCARGAEVNVRYPNGKTPLFCAAEWGRMEAARALLDAGADPRRRRIGCSPITPRG